MNKGVATSIHGILTLAFSPILALAFAATGCPAHADVIVIANRTTRDLPIRFSPVGGLAQSVTIAVDETVPFYLDGKANVSFTATGGSQSKLLDANCAYYFARSADGRTDLQKVGLGEDGTLLDGHSLPGAASRAPNATITVKILVDEEEPARQAVWERRLRHRVEAASATFEKYFHTKLQVIAVGTWNSDNSINDFIDSLSDFEHKVDPAPAQLAIGFTSQWKMTRGRTHMAGTRGPFHPYILAREGSPEINEPQKLEFLIHELGHYFGAAHSPEGDSIMRPVLGNAQPNRTSFGVHFDPVNMLAMSIISEEMRRRNLTKVGQLYPDTRKRLGQIYTELAHSLPDDPAALIYAQLMKSEAGTPVVASAHQILQRIAHAAIDNRSLPAIAVEGSKDPARRTGDVLTNYLVREAARAAQNEPDDIKRQAFLLAMVVGLSDNETSSAVPAATKLTSAIEQPGERVLRLTMLGQPTIRERRNFVKPFLSAVLLAAVTSTDAADAANIDRGLSEAQRPQGFSFVDVAASRAGVRFAQGVMDRRIPLGLLAMAFSASSYVPNVDGLPDKISAADLAKDYGGKDDPRFAKMIKEIDDRIIALPGYKPIGAALK